MVALPTLLSSSTMSQGEAASPMLATRAVVRGALLPPMAQFAATGIRVSPMAVMTFR